METEKKLDLEQLDGVTGGATLAVSKGTTCKYCGTYMRASSKKVTGQALVCSNCGATYNPSLADPWTPPTKAYVVL